MRIYDRMNQKERKVKEMKLIIADDSTFVCNMIEKAISAQFPEAVITLCINGEEAYDAIQKDDYDWLFTDLLMPDMSGHQLLEKIKNNNIDIKIIVITADIQKGTREIIEQYDIQDYINKPLTDDKLELLVKHLKGE